MSVIGEARREAWQSRFSRIAHTQNSDESISRDTHADHALPEPRNGKHLANTRWLSKIYLCGDERNTWFTVGNFRIVFTRGLKWWFMDIFRGIRVNGMKARERLGRTFLWGGRAGRLLGGPNLKETFLVYPCLRCVLSGAQLPPSKWDSCPFLARLVRSKGSLSVVEAFSSIAISSMLTRKQEGNEGGSARTILDKR